MIEAIANDFIWCNARPSTACEYIDGCIVDLHVARITFFGKVPPQKGIFHVNFAIIFKKCLVPTLSMTQLDKLIGRYLGDKRGLNFE